MAQQAVDRPAWLGVAKVRWRLAGLRLHNRHQVRLTRGPSAARPVVQSGDAMLLVAFQPRVDGLRGVAQQGPNLGHALALVAQQYEMCPLGHASDGFTG